MYLNRNCFYFINISQPIKLELRPKTNQQTNNLTSNSEIRRNILILNSINTL